MASDEEIINKLHGTETREATAAKRIGDAFSGGRTHEADRDDDSHRALNGLPSMTQEAKDRAMVRLWGTSGVEVMGKGARQEDDYFALLGMESAKSALRNRLLTANPKLTAGAASVHVEVIVEAAYVAAEHHQYEADRLDSVTKALKAQATPRTSTVNGKSTRI